MVKWLLGIILVAPTLAASGGPVQARDAAHRLFYPRNTPTPGHALGSQPLATPEVQSHKHSQFSSGSSPGSLAANQCETIYTGLLHSCPTSFDLPPYTPTYGQESILYTAMSTPISTPAVTPAAPICYNVADPDNAGPDQCICSQDSVITTVAPKKSGNPCPWTSLPIVGAGPAPHFTAPPQTNTYPFKITKGYEVYGCTSSLVTMYNNIPLTSCVGSSSRISAAPHATVQVGSSSQNVGTFSSMGLFTAVSSALSSACPTPKPGSSTSCTASPTLTGIAYPLNETYTSPEKRAVSLERPALASSPNGLEERETWWPDPVNHPYTVIRTDGNLILNIQESNYTSAEILNGMIIMASSFFASSASGKTCAPYQNDPMMPGSGSSTLCSSSSFAQVEYMNDALYYDTPAAFLGVRLDFQEPLSVILQEAFDCVEMLGGAFDILTLFFPELSDIALEADDVIDATCELIMKKKIS